jgi:hypothetical protein
VNESFEEFEHIEIGLSVFTIKIAIGKTTTQSTWLQCLKQT